MCAIPSRLCTAPTALGCPVTRAAPRAAWPRAVRSTAFLRLRAETVQWTNPGGFTAVTVVLNGALQISGGYAG